MVGMLATSKAGHDKNTTYVIIGEEKEYVYLADGRIRTMERPKKKKCRHIQIIRRNGTALLAEQLSDITIRKILKEYHKKLDGKEGGANV